MNTANTLLLVGLIIVILYLLMGIDDFVWDIAGLFRRRSYREQLLDLHKLDSTPPKLLAIAIAAWHEDNVLGDVIDNVLSSVLYPKSMYHIFLGVYPNDPATIAVAESLAARYPNVHVVINSLPGPTSKAQNINYIYRFIRGFEEEHGWRFASLSIHDSEDVVHPYEFKVTNYLLDTHKAIQFPVFPLMPMPRFSNFFRNITASTYADEFAENHFTTMVGRYSSGAFVPSAGTGFVLSHDVLDLFGDEDILPQDSLTEDYRVSLTLYEKGIQLYYVLEQIPRVGNDNRLHWDFIATRSMFPNTFKTAVRQKSRWILGITMQSFRFREIFQANGLPASARYTLYKDSKAKVANLLAMLGYPLLVYFIVSLFVPLLPIYPIFSLSWWLSVFVTFMMLERQAFRIAAIDRVYGLRSVFFGCLLPPLMPLRLIWGNIINLAATLRAYRQYNAVKRSNAKHRAHPEKRAANTESSAAAETSASAETSDNAEASAPKKLTWSKTDHQFLGKQALQRYQRNLGDILLEKGYLSIRELTSALLRASLSRQKIGAYLREHGLLTEEQLLDALSAVKHIPFVKAADLSDYAPWRYAGQFDESLLRSQLVLPLLKTKEGFVVAFCDQSPNDAQTALRTNCGCPIRAVFASQQTIEAGLTTMFHHGSNAAQAESLADSLYETGAISEEQLLLFHTYRHRMGMNERDLLLQMGLVR